MKLAIAILIAALAILSGCAVTKMTKMVDTTDSAAQDTTAEEATTDASDLAAQATVTEDVTAEQTASEADALLLEEEDEIDIGEML